MTSRPAGSQPEQPDLRGTAWPTQSRESENGSGAAVAASETFSGQDRAGLPESTRWADHSCVSAHRSTPAASSGTYCSPTAGRDFEVRLLGPVRAVRRDREIALGGPQKRAVLALLLLEPGRVVPAGRLIEELWRGGPPKAAAITLRSYVSRLRAVLAPDAALEGRGGGYVIT